MNTDDLRETVAVAVSASGNPRLKDYDRADAVLAALRAVLERAPDPWHRVAVDNLRAFQVAETERDDARAALTRVRALCDEQEAYCAGGGVDVPHWVVSVRAALGGDTDAP